MATKSTISICPNCGHSMNMITPDTTWRDKMTDESCGVKLLGGMEE